MGEIVIKIENLSKLYRLGQVGTGTLGHDLNRWWAKARGKEDPYAKIGQVNDRTKEAECEYVWALKDINFEVKHGEMLGIIGRNGAGKSTLLKLISRITAPTTGEIKAKGRIASLLEVGTGMHPDMTARDNIFLNGAILGMKRQEIARKFDEIVDFAGCAMYVDTPVKRYSSGMRVRLGFAVAAFLEPDILIVDEVLAVGDAEFQKKAIGKMKEVSSSYGRTVLFVSHNMTTITSLCQNCILLDAGQIVKRGKTSEVVMVYYGSVDSSPASFDATQITETFGDEYVQLLSGEIRNNQNQTSVEILIEEPFTIAMRYQILKQNEITFVPNIHLYTTEGVCVFVSADQNMRVLQEGEYLVECEVPGSFLNEGSYYVGLAISSLKKGVKVHFYARNSLGFTIKDPIYDTKTRKHGYSGPIPGVVRPDLTWRTKRIA